MGRPIMWCQAAAAAAAGFFFSLFFPAGVWRLCRRATWPLYKSSHSRLEVCVVSASPRPVFLPLPPARCPPLPPPLSLPARLSDSSFTLPPVVSLPPASAPSKKQKQITEHAHVHVHALWLKQQTDVWTSKSGPMERAQTELLFVFLFFCFFFKIISP